MDRFGGHRPRLRRDPLELARFPPRPALNYDLRFGVELHGVSSLSMEYAEEALLPTADREISHGRGHADVDADVSRRRFVAKLARRGATGGKQRSLIAERTLADELDGVVNRIGVNQTQHRPENLRVVQRT